MNKLQIKNVGPIRNGMGSGYMEFDSLTVFLGPQASGKSTIAKIYSSMVWLEKAILRDELSVESCEQESFFIDKVISYQGIQSYFNSRSSIHFIGKGCDIRYEAGKLTIKKLINNEDFDMPKIMYVPAERNFLTAIPGTEFIKGLPKPLHSFLAEYQDAKKWVQRQKSLELPIGNVSFAVDESGTQSFLRGDDYQTDLLHGSSGLQSLIPLYVVTRYLTSLVLNLENDPSRELYSVVQTENIKKKVQKELAEKRENAESAQYDNILDIIEQIVRQYLYKSFINIVEEPEQNLYPDSQKQVLFSLIASLNQLPDNQLVITSHSPYILNLITLCTEAWIPPARGFYTEEQRAKRYKIVPMESTISIDRVNVYQLNKNGDIEPVDKSEGYINDEHALNAAFEQINMDFSNILDV